MRSWWGRFSGFLGIVHACIHAFAECAHSCVFWRSMLRLHVYSLASSSFLFWWCLSLHSHLLLLSWRGICVVGLIAALIACHLWPLAGDEPHQRFNSMLLQFRAMTAMFSPASLTAIQGHSELSGMHYCSTPGPLFTRKRLFRLNIWFIFLAHDDHRS